MPTTFAGVLIFLVLIAPGVLWDIRADRRRAVAKQSALREIGRVILASLVFSAPAFLAVVALAHFFPAVFAWPFGLAVDPQPESSGEAARAAAVIGAQLAIALGLAWGVEALRQHRGKSSMRSISTWDLVLGERVPSGAFAHVRVRLKSGTTWVGRVGPFSADLETTGRELILQKPLASAKAGKSPVPVPESWESVLIAGDDIDWIAVRYVTYVEPLPGWPPVPAGPEGAASVLRPPEDEGST